ncbi:MAG TPA: response regulator, partial [Gemmatimonadaceae bacterium]|nr:response regulator [Gemmatimonadaceae bacterium]
MTDNAAASRPPLVLIANDQEWSSRSIESILGPHGYAVLRAHTGKHALELAQSADVGAVVLDLRLADMSGVDVCRQLRDGALISASAPVIVTSVGSASYAERLEVFGAGAWAFMTQPFDGTQLLLQLETFLRARREVEALRESSLLDLATG